MKTIKKGPSLPKILPISSKKKKVIGTPYDDGYRTIVEKCPRLLIPIVNEMFGTSYDMDAEVIPLSNEFFMLGRSGENKKVITDTYVRINGTPYHIECQSSNDGTMVIRMFEYDVQIGMNEANNEIINGNEYYITFPYSGVMYLRKSAESLAPHKIVINTPGGSVSYEIPTLKVTTYSLDEIFEKNLLFLIPFYLFSLESELKAINEDKERLDQLTDIYIDIHNRLSKLNEEGKITTYEFLVLRNITMLIAQNVALKEENVKERIGEIMGGQILDLECTKIYDEGLSEGLSKGFSQGTEKGKMEERKYSISILIKFCKRYKLSKKETALEIAKEYKIPLPEAKKSSKGKLMNYPV